MIPKKLRADRQPCQGAHHRDPDFATASPRDRVRVSGIRIDHQEGPRLQYRNPVARHYAELGYTKFAEVLEAGHGCAACHLTRASNGIPKDEALDLDRYHAVAVGARVARTIADVGTTAIMGAAAQLEVLLAKDSIGKIVLVAATEEADPLVARLVAQELLANPVAARSYAQLQRQGTDVQLYFGPAAGSDMGRAHLRWNIVRVNMRNHANAKDAVSTIVHEASHVHRFARGSRLTLLDEVRARTREHLYRTGKRPSARERRAIWQVVRGLDEYRMYPER